MPQTLDWLAETPSQTAGPYVHIGCTPRAIGIDSIYPDTLAAEAFSKDAPGERITVTGRIIDGTGTPLKDVMVESWQAGADGTFGPGAEGHARFIADLQNGVWTLETIKPGVVNTRDGRPQAPHIDLWIVARGINLGLATRIYFAGDALEADPLLGRIEQPERRETLVAKAIGPNAFSHDIHLQGERETVFLDL